MCVSRMSVAYRLKVGEQATTETSCILSKAKDKAHPCTGTEARYRRYGPQVE